jgi:topoisomerase-4 subunit A
VRTEGQDLHIISGQRAMTLRWVDLVAFGGQRAQRGSKLPRGWQRVERIEAVTG